jgi:AcrR family transcriptional regulator
MDTLSNWPYAEVMNTNARRAAPNRRAAPKPSVLLSGNVVPLPNSRRAVTRARICDAAKELFFTRGFNAATMEEIAEAVGIRRSTLYLHFREKEEILVAIAQDYTGKIREVIARLPGPEPTREQIATWVREMAEFTTRERAPTELLASLSHLPKTPAAVLAFGEDLKQMMAAQLDAFRRAFEPGEDLARAWAMSTLDGLGRALTYYARGGGDEFSKCRLTVATELLSRFVRGEV